MEDLGTNSAEWA